MNQLLINPFRKITSLYALLIGLISIILTAIVAYYSHTRFDGLIDFHYSSAAPIDNFLIDGLLNWICLTVIFYFISLIVSKANVRLIDVAGFMALARLPLIIPALIGFTLLNNESALYLSWKLFNIGEKVTLQPGELFIFIVAFFIIIFVIIWTIVLIYKAFKVSSNIKGQKAILAFVIGLFVCEIIIKVVLLSLGKLSLTYLI